MKEALPVGADPPQIQAELFCFNITQRRGEWTLVFLKTDVSSLICMSPREHRNLEEARRSEVIRKLEIRIFL